MPLAGMTSLGLNMQNIEAICLFHSWDIQLKLVLFLNEMYMNMTFPSGSVRKCLHFIFFTESPLVGLLLDPTEEFLRFPDMMFTLGGDVDMLHAILLTRLMYLYFKLLSVFMVNVWIS